MAVAIGLGAAIAARAHACAEAATDAVRVWAFVKARFQFTRPEDRLILKSIWGR